MDSRLAYSDAQPVNQEAWIAPDNEPPFSIKNKRLMRSDGLKQQGAVGATKAKVIGQANR